MTLARVYLHVDSQQVKVVATRSRRVLYSVKLPGRDAEMPPIGSSVLIPIRNLAPADLYATHRGMNRVSVGCLSQR
jgi:hypothetical protein